MKKLPKFSIDLKASAKGERKKVVKYLRKHGYSVVKRKDCLFYEYLTNHGGDGQMYSMMLYHGSCSEQDIILTLPRDWDKLVELVEGEKSVEEFKVGDWVKVTSKDKELVSGHYYGHVGRIISLDYVRAGVHKTDIKHGSSDLNVGEGHCRKATSEEIKEALIKEAKKRGFVNGVEYISVTLGNKAKTGYNFDYYITEDQLTDRCGGTVYHKGQWAEIITDSVPEVNGHKMEVEGPDVRFGCAQFYAKSLRHLHSSIKYFEGNRSIKSVTLDSGVTITAEQLNEIINYLNK